MASSQPPSARSSSPADDHAAAAVAPKAVTAATLVAANQAAPRKSHNVRALANKAISYQKRQLFTNICCIRHVISTHTHCCPLFFVLISAVLGAVIQKLILRSQTIEDIQFCSNIPSLYPDGFPRYNTTDPLISRSNDTGNKAVNFIRNVNLAGITQNPGAARFGFVHPCVYWFGESYPNNSPVYERNSNGPPAIKIDSTYFPPPDGGWLTVLTNGTNTDAIRRFTQYQLNFWAVSGASTDSLTTTLGTRKTDSISTAEIVTFLNGSLDSFFNPSFSASGSTSYGILGAIGSRIFVNVSSGTSIAKAALRPVPYFSPVNQGYTSDSLDDDLTNRINMLLTDLASLNKTVLQESTPSAAELTDFYLRAGVLTAKMPHAAIFLDTLDAGKLVSRYVLHVGTDKRIEAAANFPTKGQRLVTTMTQLSQATLKYFGSTASAGSRLINARITQGIRAFPDTQSTEVKFEFAGIIGRILYPFGVSFLLPIFVIVLVKGEKFLYQRATLLTIRCQQPLNLTEKEDRILAMMKMNGMKAWAYYLSHYVTFYVLFAISSIIFILVGFGARLTLFTKTATAVVLLLFFTWGHAQIALAFFFASFFNRSRIALVLTFLVVLCGVIISLVTDQLFEDEPFPRAFFLWPPFAFYRALSVLNVASYDLLKRPFQVKDLRGDNEVTSALAFLAVEIFVYGFIGMYLAAVLPSEYGTRRPWHFPVTDVLTSFEKKSKKSRQSYEAELSASQLAAKLDETAGNEDEDVIAERQRVDSNQHPADAPIVISHLRKVYASRAPGSPPKVAVKDVTFAAESGLVFGLLGPNGAGKTTLISMLTGLYEATSGNAWLSGYNIKSEISDVYKVIGICPQFPDVVPPQFDILWDDLNVEEHLYFYARLKGVERAEERPTVEKAMEQVSLTSLRRRLTKTLSGGEKRRLSIAIALVGTPSVVFLDEPTTGLDPEVRRLIWNIIQDAKEDKTIILTTHSMEEAEAVCQRIGIMSKGTLRCYANPLRLKELYGSGFRLFFNSLPQDTARACAWVEGILPAGFQKLDAFATSTSYEFSSGPGIIPMLLRRSKPAGKRRASWIGVFRRRRWKS
ncbi:hypothetical protein DFJ73DRAFT_758520 [Zopfochytrium polystomum]|nr:hypothetical protein DFJ73DRAFT_758520 [Zopfochytrium polystomum]